MVAFAKDYRFSPRSFSANISADRIFRQSTARIGIGGFTSRTITFGNRLFIYDACLSPSLAQRGQGEEKGFFDFNYTKTIVAGFNIFNASRLAASGVLKIGIGGVGKATGVGEVPGNGMIALGYWNLNSARAAFLRGNQQFAESSSESFSDVSWRNLLGIAPFGQNFDDTWELTPQEFFKQKWTDLTNDPSLEKAWEFIKEVGTFGG